MLVCSDSPSPPECVAWPLEFGGALCPRERESESVRVRVCVCVLGGLRREVWWPVYGNIIYNIIVCTYYNLYGIMGHHKRVIVAL